MTTPLGPVAAESYPTFWDAIPVESPPHPESDAPGHAYETFLNVTEDGPVATLHVEQTEVG